MVCELIYPDWPAPSQVRSIATTRSGGFSVGAYASLNLSTQVGDNPNIVAQNRVYLSNQLELPNEPCWLRQVHGKHAFFAEIPTIGTEADAIVTNHVGIVCAVMTADCLPILLCAESGLWVAAIHAGWRGLAAGVIENAVAAIKTKPERLLAWLGPAIGSSAFVVGSEVRLQFIAEDPTANQAFEFKENNFWLANLYQLARLRLTKLGIERIFGHEDCTFSQPERYFSYRRDGQTGRMASLIWLQN